MGEVYKATDTRLGRVVAIKVLPSHVADDPQLRQRFEREARTLATLSHPHICPVFDVGSQNDTDFLVMEFLDGETLAQRLQKGALPLDQALRYAIEIADALDKAHRRGIVHRDLKPGNIMVTRSGIKLLDFGLAKLRPVSPPGGVAVSVAPTVTSPLTGQGSIVGTFQYMAPEQLDGQEADARSDIFAFGAVVYEMITGIRAFAGKSQASLISSIIKDDPRPIPSIQPTSPPALDHVVRTCLAKDPEQRWQAAGDVGRNLQWILDAPSSMDVRAGTVSSRSRWRSAWPWAAIVVGSALVAILLRSGPAPAPVSRPVRFAVNVSSTGWQENPNGPALVALSPDGSTIVYASRHQLYRRAVGQLALEPVGGTEGAIDNINTPFFSPDGLWLGYWLAGSIRKVPAAGGSPVKIVDAVPRGASWGPGDVIVFGTNQGLVRVSANGGEPESVTKLDKGEVGHYRPDILPNGEGVLFTVWSGSLETAQIAVVSLRTGERHSLLKGSYPRYASTGHIVFAREDSLWAVPFDIGRLQVTGPAAPVVNGVRVEAASGVAQFAVAGSGSLLYATAGTGRAAQRLVWVDRQGREDPVPIDPGPYSEQRVSPDGTRIALTVAKPENVDVWIWHLARRTLTRLTFDDGPDRAPLWTRDGSRVVFQSSRDGGGLFWKAADGTGQVEQLMKNSNRPVGRSWSADGRLIFDTMAPGARDIGMLRVGEPGNEMLLAAQYYEQSAALSPDGRWLAYQSDESGQSEIYVRPFPGVDAGKWQVSTSGGSQPLWAPDGKELFYLRGTNLMVAQAQAAPTFSTTTPEVMLKATDYSFPTLTRGYDLSPDGRRFLLLKPEPGSTAQEAAPELIFVEHWVDDLRRLAPGK